MVRNFGERRKKKNNKKSKGKGSRGGKDMEEVDCREVAIYEPPEQREAEDGKSKQAGSSKPRNTYRSKRMERQRQKKDRKGSRGDWGYDDYPEEDGDDDDGDYGGEYDEVIRTGPSRREARELDQMQEQMASLGFVIGTSRRRTGRRGYNGRNGYDGGHIHHEEFSMLDLLMMAIGSRLSL